MLCKHCTRTLEVLIRCSFKVYTDKKVDYLIHGVNRTTIQ